MVLTRLTHRTHQNMPVSVRFDIPGSTAYQYVNYRVYLTNASNLKGKRITGLAALPSPGMFYAANVVNTNYLKAFTITLCATNGDILIDQYPLADLILYRFNKIYSKPRRFNCFIDPDQSYVQLLDTTATTYNRGDLIQLMFWFSEK